MLLYRGVCVTGRLWIYISSLFAMSCSWSVVVFCLRIAFWDFYWLTVLPANSSKTDLLDLKWCCFSMFLSSYSYVLFRCVNRYYPLSYSNFKPKYFAKPITLLLLYQLYAIHPNIVDSDYILSCEFQKYLRTCWFSMDASASRTCCLPILRCWSVFSEICIFNG